MSEPVKAGLIIGASLIAAASIWVYFSPYQTCLRLAFADNDYRRTALYCAEALAGGRR